MGIAGKVGDWAFKAFTAGLGVATIYLTATFSVNVYRGLAWHNAQSVRHHISSSSPLIQFLSIDLSLSLFLPFPFSFIIFFVV
uniref:Uncharacterized protein n=1 Tax=Nelumbo nucifera TaxID=4432 RepID=A0A822YFZ9_NELNU|nr:TPA_asm: hypothetical protein HUJ06_009944 [Nelumbo nucifera]